MSTAKKATFTSSRSADKFVVRFPDDMRDRIAEVAKHNHRSMNSEIVARLETSLKQDQVMDYNNPVALDENEITVHERELLQRFRQLTQRQQNALLALIAYDLEQHND
ncbi:Arc family DNA-binding protein [Thiopseudomonas denitrificans]|uniref:Arc-like DNA binding dprotein n=1 Tax=Thiopseudomonas denitrificans TaxID=1501432 RepID=A0A4R6U0Y2_9GAMM|nr:Arc family DNA-binding protein [Thiopseudomonas denitrificans]TDQ40008.1 Arc-like DNA binding dprotein [Thiopseudomonas denitrificans]